MTVEPRWTAGAIEDLQAGHDWYDERDPGIGRYLAAEVFKALDQATRHPSVLRRYEHPNLPAEPAVHKIQLERFDEYGLVYTVVDGTFWIVAIAHAKRRPGYWVTRLTDIDRPPEARSARDKKP